MSLSGSREADEDPQGHPQGFPGNDFSQNCRVVFDKVPQMQTSGAASIVPKAFIRQIFLFNSSYRNNIVQRIV